MWHNNQAIRSLEAVQLRERQLWLFRNLVETQMIKTFSSAVLITFIASSALAVCPYDYDCLDNPYGAGSPYKSDGLMNPYSSSGSPYSNESWTNPYATNAPKIYDQNGNYRGQLSSNPYAPDSTSNPYGQYGSQYSPDSINNPFGAGNPYGGNLYVIPSQ